MAEVIEKFPAEVRTRSTKYDYDKYLDGRVWVLKHGEDFTVKPDSMRGAFYNHAKRNGLNVKVGLMGAGRDQVVVQYLGEVAGSDRPEPEPGDVVPGPRVDEQPTSVMPAQSGAYLADDDGEGDGW